jgi:uncharacterized membrane protein YuzA (DUF378 family)
MDTHYYRKKLYMFAALLLVIGGLNWGVVALTGGDLVSRIFGRGSVAARGIFFAVALAAAAFLFQRNFYLPFLGEAHIPCSVLKDMTPEGANTSVSVHVRPGAKIVYWAAEPANEDLKSVVDYRAAYLEYKNAGVTTADADGMAELKVRTPQGYVVPLKGMLPPHVHYRVCGERPGFMGPIVTITMDGKEYFANYVSREESDEPVTGIPEYDFVKPRSALEEVNSVAQMTAQKSLMPESGAPDEAPAPGGYDLDAAFAPPALQHPLMLTGSTPDGDRVPQGI